MLKALYRYLKKQYRTAPTDDYIRRLRSLVIGDGMLHEGNLYLMDRAIRAMPDGGAVIEIGSYGGLSTNLTTHLLEKYGKSHPFFNCDAWIYEGFHDSETAIAPVHIDGREDILRSSFADYLQAAFMAATRLLSAARLPHSFHLRSADFFDKWQENAEMTDLFGRWVTLGGPIAFAYIDGDHSLAAARADFESVRKYLLPGGFILLDDSADHLPFGSAQLMREIRKMPEFEILPANPNYLIRKKL